MLFVGMALQIAEDPLMTDGLCIGGPCCRRYGQRSWEDLVDGSLNGNGPLQTPPDRWTADHFYGILLVTSIGNDVLILGFRGAPNMRPCKRV